MRILTSNAMRQVDRAAIAEIGIPGIVLMENAASGVADALCAEYPEAGSAAIICGPGNNGGDGLALGRLLDARGYEVRLVLASGGKELSGDAGKQLAICREMDLDIWEWEGPGGDGSASVESAVARADVVVDSLFGTGLSRPLTGDFASLVEYVKGLPQPIVAVDLPSGLDASLAEVPGPTVEADLTVTFAAPKIAHVFPPACFACGRVVVADLGIPSRLVEEAEGDLHLLEAEDVALKLPVRAVTAHKGDVGHVLILAGSTGKAGAAVLAARGAVRTGTGLVTVAVPEPILHTVDGDSIESMTSPLPVVGDGGLAPGGHEALRALLEGKRAWAAGPGLGQAASTQAFIREAVLSTDQPLVLDADGLNAFAGRLADLAERRGPTILTPHPGEMARLLDADSQEVTKDRAAAARRAAQDSGAIVVLKGHLTLIADPLGGVYVNPTGNPGMATGGSGDVLTGMIAGLAAQGLEPLDAALAGVFSHGRAGDLVAEESGQAGLTAADLAEAVPRALNEIAER